MGIMKSVCVSMLTALVMVATAPLFADDTLEDAAASFALGHYEAAIGAGRTAGGIAGLTIACRAGLTLGGLVENGIGAVARLHDALGDCIAAHRTDPDNVVARVSLALAIGFEGKRLKRPSYARAARRLIENGLERNGDSMLLHGALAGWHGEVSAAGALARMVLGARSSRAAHHFQQALALDGNNDLPLRYQYARFLARRGGDEETRQARALLETIIAQVPADHLERLLQDRARSLLQALDSGKKRRLSRALKSSGAFVGIEKHRDIAKADIDPDDFGA